MYADIIVDITHEQLDRTFQYAIPDELMDDVHVGSMVNVPFGKGNRMITGYVIEIGSEAKFPPEKTKSIDSIVSNKLGAVEKMIKLASWLKYNYGSTMNQALKTVIPVKEKVKQKEKKIIHLCIDDEETESYVEKFKKKNSVARLRLLEALKETPDIDYELIKSKLNISMQTVKAMEDMGILEIEVETSYRNPLKNTGQQEKKIILNEEQKNITEKVIADYDNDINRTYLIKGVTGSGKTEVYMEIIEHVVNKGRQVIMLIPEIALTFQTVQRFYNRFGDRVSIMNSRMSKGERYDQFMRAMRGEIDIIIGPRSALFTPFSNIGLIVIDEEHESAYKSETTPKYDAVSVAIHIAKESNAPVILGSATPSVESYYKAQSGEYELLTLNNRAGKGRLPKVYVEDLRKELKEGNRSIFSRRLKELITDRINKKEQIMLFINKRGYAGFISCRACGHVIKCPHCDVSLTMHNNGKMLCHYCGYEQQAVKLCPECGSRYISGFRTGTQAVEEMVQKTFPGARTLRMDMDTTKGKEGHEKILSAFADNEADILIGTQMIVKGHDFPNVTLVGVLAADMSLYSSDYTAAERTFQLLTQAAGRAGRAEIPGEVVIQTYTPEHYSIVAASKQDYEEFYEKEISYRSLLSYPPVCNMMVTQLSSQDEDKLTQAAMELKNFIDGFEGGNKDRIIAIGPANASVYKINDVYYKDIHVRAKRKETLTYLLNKIENYIKENQIFNKINVQFDFKN